MDKLTRCEMKVQLISKMLLIIFCAASLYFTGNLLQIYIEAVTGELRGAGGAQWQMAFLIAPVPSVLGCVGVAISSFSRPRLSWPFVSVSVTLALAPLILLGMVMGHVY